MLAKDNEYLQEAAESLYVANADEIVREQCIAREDAERRERTLERDNRLLKEENADLNARLEEAKANAEKARTDAEKAKIDAERAKTDAEKEIGRLKSLLLEHGISEK